MVRMPSPVRWFLAAIALLGTAPAAAQPVFPDEHWRTPSADAPSGWSAEQLKAADELAGSFKTDAYLIVHRGLLVHRYGDIAKPMNLASVRKSLLSILYGMHVARGEIRLDATLAELDINDKQGLTDTERSATVRQLLQSRSGVYHPAAYETPDAKAQRPARGSHAPGSFWYYNNWDFNALGTIFERRTGLSVFQALKAELADPLQFEDFRFPQDTESVLERASEHPAYAMFLSARDLARVGLLMARGGQWRGRALVPPEWIAESTRAYSTVPPGFFGYGYMWWVPQRGWRALTLGTQQVFFGQGVGGQFLVVDPARDLVIVHRIDNSRLAFLRGDVSMEKFAELLVRIMAAAPQDLRAPS